MTTLPQGWATATIGDVCVPCEQREPGANESIRYIDIGSVDRVRKVIATPQPITGADAPSRARKAVRVGDVLVSMTRPNLNAVAMVPAELDGQIASTGFEVLRGTAVDPRWLYYTVRTTRFVEAMTELVQGALYPAVRPRDVRGFGLPVAPLPEQRRIADKLDALLARVEACRDRLERVPAILRRFRQSVLAASMSGDLSAEWRESKGRSNRLPAFIESDLANVPWDAAAPSLPSTWRVVRAQDVVEPDAGIVYGIVQPGPKLASGIRYVQITDIVDGRIQLPNVSYTSEEIASGYRRSSIREGDVLLGIIRALKVAVVPAELDGANISRSVARLRPREGVLPEFLAYVLQSPVVQDWLRSQHRGMDMPVLNLSEVRLAPIPIAPTDEQAEIVRRVESLLALADAVEARYTAARAQVDRLAPALLSKAFRGELVPQDPKDEPASALLARLREPAAGTEAPPARKPSRRPTRSRAKEAAA